MNKTLLTLVALTVAVSANVNINAATELLVDTVQDRVSTDNLGLTVHELSIVPASGHASIYASTGSLEQKKAEVAAYNKKVAEVAVETQKQHDAIHAAAVQDMINKGEMPISTRVWRNFSHGKKHQQTIPLAIPVGVIGSTESASAISKRVVSIGKTAVKTDIVNTTAAAQQAALSKAITTAQAIVDAKKTEPTVEPTVVISSPKATVSVATPSRLARFTAAIRNNKGKVAAGTVLAIALALGAYYGIPAYKAYVAMQAYNNSYRGMVMNTLRDTASQAFDYKGNAIIIYRAIRGN